MSETFKYLDNADPQQFLKGKMKTVANASEGVIPGGSAYEKYGKMPTDGGVRTADFRDSNNNGIDDRDEGGNSNTSTAKSKPANNGFTIQGGGTNDDPMYTSGKWGKGGMSPEALAEKFGLDRTEAKNPDGGHKDGDIWGTDAKGNKVYIGTVTDESSLMGNSELLKAHSAQADGGEIDHSSSDAKLSSSGDLNGAILNLWDGSGGNSKATTAEPEKERTPIKHSPEIQEAKERVRSYEDNVLSGKTSNDIYGKSNAIADRNFMDDYQLNLNKGQVGVGSPDSNEEASNIATDSFLDSKKTSIKKDYQFRPHN